MSLPSDKSSLMKSILGKFSGYSNLPNEECLLDNLSNLMKKCHYLKIRSISNEFFNNNDFNPNNMSNLIEAFRLYVSKMNDSNSFLKSSISEADCDNDFDNLDVDTNNENISISSDDLENTNQEEPQALNYVLTNPQSVKIDSDSDIEIIDEDKTVDGPAYNTRKHHLNNCKENTHNSKHRYELRNRKVPIKKHDYTNFSRQTPHFYKNQSQNQKSEDSEVIQIEDSSDEDDVLEIKTEINNDRKNEKNRQSSFQSQATQADPSQLASIPFIVQFPTMQSATFNGHLYVSHNYKFSAKLQGIDPRNFKWNS